MSQIQFAGEELRDADPAVLNSFPDTHRVSLLNSLYALNMMDVREQKMMLHMDFGQIGAHMICIYFCKDSRRNMGFHKLKKQSITSPGALATSTKHMVPRKSECTVETAIRKTTASASRN